MFSNDKQMFVGKGGGGKMNLITLSVFKKVEMGIVMHCGHGFKGHRLKSWQILYRHNVPHKKVVNELHT